MARDSWKSRPAPRPTTIHEIARRYHAAATALAQTLGLSVAEVLAQHRESVTAIFIETGKCDIRLPAGVQLPPLAAEAPVATTNGQAVTPVTLTPIKVEPEGPEMSPPPNGRALPTIVPSDGDWPGAGQEVTDLKPAVLRMLIAKAAALIHAGDDSWTSLLAALQFERQRRVEAGRRSPPAPVEGDGHGG